ncbi:hypothetical protein EON62_03465 [archaeon]|nr:MAG: hypothetical protein EON62_03465 [archaeon]
MAVPRGSRYDDDEDEEPGRRRGAGSGNVIAPYPVSAEQQVASPARGQAAMQPVLAAGAPGPHPLPAAASSAVTMPAPSRHNPLLHGCRPVTCYQPLGKIDEGTYGVVYHARDIETGEEVALKKIKFDASVANEGFPITALRETNVLLMLRHPNIVSVREMVVGRKKDEFYMVMDYMDHDVKGMMAAAKHPLSQAEVKCLMQQLLRGVAYMHANWVIHRDLKTSNLLMDNAGRLCVADFGLARKYGSPVRSYTQSVVTLWYRAPELLLGATTYTTAVDMWSVGCIFAELLSKKPLFQAHTEMKQLSAIFDVLGTPTDDAWPAWRSLRYATEFAIKPRAPVSLRQVLGKGVISFGGGSTVTESGMDLLRALLCLNPDGRCTAAQALQHPWFTESPPPTEPHLMPICPPSRKR